MTETTNSGEFILRVVHIGKSRVEFRYNTPTPYKKHQRLELKESGEVRYLKPYYRDNKGVFVDLLNESPRQQRIR